jgi:cytoskeletal protein RodZ
MLYLSYVYWTVHHLVSWIKRDQFEATYFIISLFNAQHVSDVNTSILRSFRLIWWVISWVVLHWCDVWWCYGVVRLGWCDIRMQPEALAHNTTTPPQPNYNVTPTHIVPEQYNPWNNSTNKSQAPEDGCINIRNILCIK